MSPAFHVLLDGDAWCVWRRGSSKPFVHYRSKRLAIQHAWFCAQRGLGEVVVEGDDGALEERVRAVSPAEEHGTYAYGPGRIAPERI